jgi:Protein of unknown function (DUF1572)
VVQNRGMPLEFTTSYLKDSIDLLRYYKKLGERAIAQVPDEALTATLDAESNSIAIIVKHLTGNMQSRWTEFEAPPQTRAEMLQLWEASWKIVFDALAPLTDADLSRTVLIRGERHSVMQAIHRQVAHYAYHIGQIVYIAKHCASSRWTSLTIPRGKSADYNARVNAGELSQR